MKSQNKESGTSTVTMRIVRKSVPVSRRGFLTGTGAAALVAGLSPTQGLAQSARRSWTADFNQLGAETAATLLLMARDIFPHDNLGDKYYVAVIRPYEEEAGRDADLKKMIHEGIADLDRAGQQHFKQNYAEIPQEMDRIGLLMAIQNTPFFQRIRGDMVTSLYNNKDVWPFFGYEGSSWEKGGYLHRGFDDIDWL